MPYIEDIKFIHDKNPDPVVDNYYELIPVDINEANLRMELKKLRNKSKSSNILNFLNLILI
jgi:hypothetical protein